MRAIKKARQLIEAHPAHEASHVLSELVLALESGGPFELGRLYELDSEICSLALEILSDWRLDRYYVGKARLFDVSWQVKQIPQQA